MIGEVSEPVYNLAIHGSVSDYADDMIQEGTEPVGKPIVDVSNYIETDDITNNSEVAGHRC